MPSTPRPVYVAATGNDGTGNGTSRKPFATVARAATFRRGRGWNPTMTHDQYVYVAPGDYWQTELEMGPDDSGSSGHRVRYTGSGDPGEARLIGGRQPEGWEHITGSIYRTPCATPVWTMYENGVRGVMARVPILNPGVDFPCSKAPYFVSEGVDDSTLVVEYDPGDFDPSVWTDDFQLVCWSRIFAATDWFTDTHTAAGLNTGTSQITLADSGMKFYARATGGNGARYFVQGPLDLLVEAGNFTCTGGFLYYWARDGAIADQEIIIPTTKRVIALVGDDDETRVSGVTFDGIAVEGSDFNQWYRFGAVITSQAGPNDYSYQAQLSLARNGLVYLENTDNVTVTRCHLSNAGFAGVYMREYGRDNSIDLSWIEHTGTSAIYVEGRAPGDGDVIGDNTYDDLRLNNFGELAGDGVAIRINQSGNNTLTHLDISQGPRQGVVMTGWDDQDAEDMYCVDNTLSYSRITDVGQDSGDMGAVTIEFMSRIGVQTMNQIIIDGVTAHASVLDAPPTGVFFDNQSDGQHASNVQVSNTQGAQLRCNDSPSGTHVLTNCSFLADGTANPSFNAGLMDTANIGTTAEFPY